MTSIAKLSCTIINFNSLIISLVPYINYKSTIHNKINQNILSDNDLGFIVDKQCQL